MSFLLEVHYPCLVLKATNTRATFFVNGFHTIGEGDENEDNALAAFKRTVADGHIIANHSWNHMLHNCCNDEGKCGSVVCNEIGMWNVKAYQNIKDEVDLLDLNTKACAKRSSTKLRMNSMLLVWRCGAGTLSWGPENWGDADPANTLTTAEDLAKTVAMLSKADACENKLETHSMRRNYAFCDSDANHGKVNILTHDFLFEDGPRGMGATTNLPKLRDFIQLMRSEGYVFKTLDQYHSTRIQRDADGTLFRGKASKTSSRSGKSGKNSRRL
ncbi:hypothetical protein ACHAWF_015180 [Thalassiosira exigua]